MIIRTIIAQFVAEKIHDHHENKRLGGAANSSGGPAFMATVLGKRGLALAIDLVPVIFIVATISTTLESATGYSWGLGLGLFWFPTWLAARIIYHTPCEAMFGRTLGKLVVGLRVEGENGEKPSWLAASIRNLLRAVDGICFNLVGALTARLITYQGVSGRRIGDILSKTDVVPAQVEAFAGVSENLGNALGNTGLEFGGGGDQEQGYTRDLTREAKRGKLDPVIGREAEIKQVVRVLGRQKKNNPVLTGEAGVGKTAIAEGLARIAAGLEGDAPAELKNKKVLELDLTAIDSGTVYRGMFEQRMQDVIRQASAPNVILFVDELHRLMGLGSSAEAEQSPGAQMLKPALARGDVTLLGATTTDEYREIEKDPALSRRFQPVKVPPLSPEATTKILEKMRPGWEAGGVWIEDDALGVSAVWAEKNLTGNLPDSAISLVDDAVSGKRGEGGGAVTKDDLADVIEEQTGIKAHASVGEMQRLRNLEDELRRRVVGQDGAVEVVARTIRRRAALGEDRPASLLFLGPSGVGKTELAKALAESLFGDEKSMTRLNMSEFSREGSEWRLIGSPTGYKESESGGQLTEAVRRKPYSVVLLDEIEKAHNQVLTLLLQLLDEGSLSDGRGNEVDFANAIIVMTSNAGAPRILAGDTSPEGATDDLIRAGFLPEIVGRMDERVIFSPLEGEDLEEIVRLLVRKPLRRAKERQGAEVAVDETLIASIARAGRDPRLGARELRSGVRARVEDRITELVMDGELHDGNGTVVLYHDEDTGQDRVLGTGGSPNSENTENGSA